MRLTLAFTPLVLLGAVTAQEPQKPNLPPQVTPGIKQPGSTTEPMVKQPVTTQVGPTADQFPSAKAKDAAAGAAASAISRAFSNPDLVVTDQPGDGRTWAGGTTWKASFGAEGTLFAPLFPNAPKHFPVTFGMPQVTVAGNALRSGGTSHELVQHTVTFNRGDFQERYQLMGKGIEQQFVFSRLPARGTIVVNVPVTTELAGQRNGGGLEFVHELGKVGYTQAVAIDASGNRLELSTELRGNSIEITVPAAFVENARLPLIIDPLVGASVDISAATAPPSVESLPDISYDVTNDEYMVVFQRFLNATDTDIYCQRMSGAFALVGGLVNIDFSFDVWENAKIANNNIANNHLVVCQVSTDGPAPWWIAGRIIAAGTGVVGAQFDIEKAGVPSHQSGSMVNPDVGGDPILVGPTYYCVVWERIYSATDRDIHFKQVNANGTLRTAAPILLENSGADYDTNPSISKSDGITPISSQYWAIAFQRRYSATDEDIRGALVDWNGVILQTGTPPANSWSVDFSSFSDRNPTVSSITDVMGGQRYMLFAYDTVNGTQSDITGRVYDITGASRSPRQDLNVLEGATAAQQAFPQKNPSADSDGCRFIVAYDEWYNAGGVDQDVLISLFSFQAAAGANGTLVLNEARQTAGYSSTVEINGEVTSVHSGGGGMTRYAGAWQDANGAANDKIEGISYDGFRAAAVLNTRPTGCGGLNITVTGNRLGDTLVLTLTNAGGFSGFVFGAPQPGAALPPCPGCQVGVANGATLTGNPQNIYLPCQLGALVGGVFAVQGFDFGPPGPCLGQIRLSDTVDIGIQ